MAGLEWVVTAVFGLPYQVYVGVLLVLAVFYYRRVLGILGLVTKMGWYTVIGLAMIGVFLALGWIQGFDVSQMLSDLGGLGETFGRVLKAVLP